MSIALDDSYVKGYYRAGKAAVLLGAIDKAKVKLEDHTGKTLLESLQL